MKKIFLFSILFLLISCFLYSCKKLASNECDDTKVCYTDSPKTLYVKLELSPDLVEQSIEVDLYKGYFDDGEHTDHFFTQKKEESYLLSVDQRYTATAKYIVDGDTIMVIDSEELGDGKYYNCDETCYNWEEKVTLDLKLEKN